MNTTKSVSRERATQMFNQDLEIAMDNIRGLLAHYQIGDWDAYIFLRKVGRPDSYVLKYEAKAGDSFASEIVRLHQQSATPSPEAQQCVKCLHVGHQIAPTMYGADDAEKQAREIVRMWTECVGLTEDAALDGNTIDTGEENG